MIGKPFPKGHKPINGFKKGHALNNGIKNPRWKGGIWIGGKVKETKREYCREWMRRKTEKKATHPRPQNCELCGTPALILKKGLCLDHDHKTGKFRGWLCGRCNLVLGMVNDDPKILISMIDYIKK